VSSVKYLLCKTDNTNLTEQTVSNGWQQMVRTKHRACSWADIQSRR